MAVLPMLLIRRSAQNFQTSPPRASALEDVVGIDVVKQDDTAAGKRRTAVLEVFLNSFVAVIVVDEDQVDGIAVSPDITLHLRGLRVAEEETPIMAKHEIADLQSPALRRPTPSCRSRAAKAERKVAAAVPLLQHITMIYWGPVASATSSPAALIAVT
jgi:hypothetical protein